MAKDAVDAVKKGAIAFFSGTILSRITGLLRDISMASVFGSDPVIAGFMIAYRLANIFRRLLGEGALPSGFVPHFSTLVAQDEKSGARFFRDVLFSLLAVLFSLLFLIIGGSFFFDRLGLVTRLTRFMMPGVAFVCLYGVTSAFLQYQKKFFLCSFAPVFFNIIWIAGIFLHVNGSIESRVWVLAFAVVVGFFLQWAALLPSVYCYFKKHLSFREVFSFSLFSLEVRAIIKPFLFGLMGVAAVQINTALDALFARSSCLEGPAYLWYALRIEQVPIGLFAVALSSALLPALSKAFAQGNKEEFSFLVQDSIGKALGLIVPCAAALFVLALPGVNLLYGRGHFSHEAVLGTVYALWGYGIGLIPSVFVLLFAPIFYAKKDFKTPMKASLVSVLVNIALNSLFVFGFQWGAFSVSLATSLAAIVNMLFLRKALGTEFAIIKQGRKTIGVSALAFIGTAFLSQYLFGNFFIWKEGIVFSREGSLQFLEFFSLSALFVFQVIVYAKWSKAKDIMQFTNSK